MNRFYGLYTIQDIAWMALINDKNFLFACVSVRDLSSIHGVDGFYGVCDYYATTADNYYLLPVTRDVGNKLCKLLQQKYPLLLHVDKLVCDRGIFGYPGGEHFITDLVSQ